MIEYPDDDDIYWRTFTSQTKQYWRLRITGLTARPKIPNFWAGARIELDMGPTGDFDPDEEEVIGEPAHGTSGGFQWTHRFRRRVINAEFRDVNDTQFADITSWWEQAGREGENWWWLTYPDTRAASPTDSDYYPVYVNCEGTARRWPYSTTVRSGAIRAFEVI